MITVKTFAIKGMIMNNKLLNIYIQQQQQIKDI